MQPKLPGTGRVRARVGRNRRALDAYVTVVRRNGDLDDFRAAQLPVLRTMADDIDAQEHDPDHSSHTLAVACSKYLEALYLWRPPTAATSVFDDIAAHLPTVVRDSPPLTPDRAKEPKP